MPLATVVRPVIRLLIGVLIAGLGVVGSSAAAYADDPTPVTPGTTFHVHLDSFESKTFTFSGSAGQRVVARQSPYQFGTVYQLSRDGLQLEPLQVATYGEIGVLNSTGTWTLAITNNSDAVDMDAQLSLVQDTTSTLAFGSPVTQSLTAAWVNHNRTFSGTAGQKVVVTVTTLELTGDLDPRVRLELVRPDGTALDGMPPLERPGLVSGVLDVSGTWTLRIDPLSDTTGSMTYTATRPAAQIITVTPGVTTTVTHSGAKDIELRVAASAGQRLTLQSTEDLRSQYGMAEPPDVFVTLLRPDHTEFGSFSGAIPGFSENLEKLPVSGTWTVRLRPSADTVGTQTLKLGLVRDISATATLGTALPLKVARPGQNETITFRGTAGRGLVVSLTKQSWTAGSAGGQPQTPGITGALYAPDGQYVRTLVSPGGTFEELESLPLTGRYTLLLDPVEDTVGTATLLVRRPTVTTATLSRAATTVTFRRAGDRARFTFDARAGQHGYLKDATWQSSPTRAPIWIRLLRPDGSQFNSWYQTDFPAFLEWPVLDAKGTWTLELDPDGDATGTVTFVAGLGTDQTANLTLGSQVTAKVMAPGQRVVYSFHGVKGSRLAMDTVKSAWSSPDVGVVSYSLISPTGSQEASFGEGYPYPTATSPTRWAELDSYRLNETGTWKLVVDPFADVTGSVTFALRQLTDLTGTITVGTARQVSVPSKGAWTDYTFASDGSGVYTWKIENSQLANGVLEFISPDGFTVASAGFGTGASSDQVQFAGETPGIWTVRVRAFNAQVGTARLTLVEQE